ncbi:hypothetical protein Tco_0493822, partial [Tanacetum coccineum]
EFRLHFANRFRAPVDTRYKLNYTFPNKLQPDQMTTLESPVFIDEVRNAVWGCGENKSPGPDGFSFEFFRKFWDTVGSDFCEAVEWFFEHSSFSRGCNSSFIALIPKNQDPKFVNDYRPISLIGSLYKAYDSIRWDFLEDVLTAFGFGPKWCSWIRGCLHSGMASVLLNVMESLHLSVSRAIEAGIFKGIKIDSTLNLSHLFYADDVSNLLGVGVRSEYVKDAAVNLGCLTMKTPFKYLGVMVGGICATSQAWEDTIGKLKARLSNWKLKTLSVGGRLTLLKSVLGSTPIYNLSIYKAPKSVLHSMESLRRNFFNGSQWRGNNSMEAAPFQSGFGDLFLGDNSLWFICRLILSMHGSKLPSSSLFWYSTWLSIIWEIHLLKDRGVDLVSHCRIHLDSSVAVKLSSVTSSLRRPVRGGSESSAILYSSYQEYIEGTILSSLED